MAIKVSVAEFMFITGYSEHVPVRRLFAVQEPGAGQFKCCLLYTSDAADE